ncbi:MAG TPA: OsmC family protein [Bryobacteraceae bacterium]|nr:OsmC family protein [Bryobacteraceae bacterium]
MESKLHRYQIQTTWTGNTGQGTAGYRAYKRDHEIFAAGKTAPIPGSSDAAFRGDPARYNPEELLVSALSSCHMLWMLHLCADAGITVTAYSDQACGVMAEDSDGSGRFTEVTLHPVMTITDGRRIMETEALHAKAHHMCFIANSVNFPVRCPAPVVTAQV